MGSVGCSLCQKWLKLSWKLTSVSPWAAADAAAAVARSHRTFASLSKVMARPEAVGALVFLALAVMLAIVRAHM